MMRRKIHPDHHPTLARALYKIAQDLHAMGGLEDAEKAARQAVDIYRTYSHPTSRQHRHHARAVRVLRQTLIDAGNPDQAILVQREHVEDCRRPPEHDLCIAGALKTLGRLLHKQGNYAEAESTLRESLEIARPAAPADDLGLAGILAMLGQSLIEQDRHAPAEPILRECLAIRERALNPDSPSYWLLPNAMSLLGGALAGQAAELVRTDRERSLALFQEAEPLLLDGYNGMKDDPRMPTPSAIGGFDRKREALERIIKFYESWNTLVPDTGKTEQAAEWRTELEELRRP